MISPTQLQRLQAKLDHVSPTEARQLLVGLETEFFANDGLLWLRFVQTRDEADPKNPVKPFPLSKPYIAEIWATLATQQEVVTAKSRQMMMSWIIAAFCVHTARYHPHQAIYYQTQGWPDAVAMVCMPSGGFAGRCQFIEDHLPEWMRQEYKPSEGRIQYPNGSMIQALAGGANQIRGKVFSLYVGDEFAFQEEQDGVHTAVSPLVQKGAKVIYCSTPNGTNNMFATLFHGRPVGTEEVT